MDDSCVGKMSHYNVPGRDKQPIELMRDGMTDDLYVYVDDLTDEDLKNVVIKYGE